MVFPIEELCYFQVPVIGLPLITDVSVLMGKLDDLCWITYAAMLSNTGFRGKNEVIFIEMLYDFLENEMN